jgi:hypothetical protein
MDGVLNGVHGWAVKRSVNISPGPPGEPSGAPRGAPGLTGAPLSPGPGNNCYPCYRLTTALLLTIGGSYDQADGGHLGGFQGHTWRKTFLF